MAFTKTHPIEFARLCLTHPATNISALSHQLGLSRQTLHNLKAGRHANLKNISKVVHHFGHRIVVISDFKGLNPAGASKGRKPRK